MADEDTRSLSGAAQAALRNRAVQAVLEGMTQAEAARVFGVHRNAVNRWIRRYWEGGFPGLAEQRRGRRPGEQPALSERQQQELIALVRDSTPISSVWRGFCGPAMRSPGCSPSAMACGWRAPRSVGICAAGGSARSGRSGAPWSRIR